MREWLDDLRDTVAVTLMGWCAKLATKQYQQELARFIMCGLSIDEAWRQTPSAEQHWQRYEMPGMNLNDPNGIVR